MAALHWVGGEGVEVVRARSFTDLRPLRMTNEFGEAPAQCNGSFVGPAFLVENFVSHPFRKERGKDGAPPAARRVRMSARLESGKPQTF